MADLNSALEAFLADTLSFEDLLLELERSRHDAPAQAPAFTAAIDEYYRKGRLPLQVYRALKARLPSEIKPAVVPEPLDDSTRFHKREASGGIRLSRPDAQQVLAAASEGSEHSVQLSSETRSMRPASLDPDIPSIPSTLSPKTVVHGALARHLGVGSTINRRFVLEELIARGGMGIVYKAKDLRKEEAGDREPYVAVKVLTEDFRQHPDALIALQRETKKAQKLAHPNIVTVHDFDRDEDTVYMTMELLEGEPLREVIRRAYPGGLSMKEAFTIIEGMCLGLAYAHKQNIVHSDFKPGNVFVTNNGLTKVLDFGIARAVRRPGQIQQDTTIFDAGSLGALTPAYASCEMLEGADPDPRDDIFALACVSYELLTGRHPFAGSPSTQARDNRVQAAPPKKLSREQWRGLQHGLSFARDRRTATVDQFWRELQPRAKRFARPWIYGAGACGLSIVFAALMVADFAQEEIPRSAGRCEEPPGPLARQLRPRVQSLLEVAEVHLLVGRIMEPPGSNAFDAYRRVLELHPHNDQACAGLARIAKHYEQQAQQAITSGRVKDARALIENGLKAQPNHTALLELQRAHGYEAGSSN